MDKHFKFTMDYTQMSQNIMTPCLICCWSSTACCQNSTNSPKHIL